MTHATKAIKADKIIKAALALVLVLIAVAPAHSADDIRSSIHCVSRDDKSESYARMDVYLLRGEIDRIKFESEVGPDLNGIYSSCAVSARRHDSYYTQWLKLDGVIKVIFKNANQQGDALLVTQTSSGALVNFHMQSWGTANWCEAKATLPESVSISNATDKCEVKYGAVRE